MRLPRASQVKLLWRNCNFKTPALVGRLSRRKKPICVFPPCHTRTLCTTLVMRKEIPQPSDQPEEKINLDIWKSMMMSPGRQEEKEEEEAPGESGQRAECSSLEATRELVEMWRQAGKLVPEQLSEEELQILEELSTKSSKKKFLKHLALKENHKKFRKIKQEKKKSEKMEEKKNREGDEEQDENAGGQLQNTFMLHVWSRSMDTAYSWRAAQAMLFGQPLVFDMSYEQHMSRRELENTVSQLLECEGWNRRSPEPFHLHFCNLQPEGGYHRELLKRYGATWDRLLITASEQRHVDVFPQSQLVYLTADSPNVLKAFDQSKVYIVGALVDKSIQTGVSLANAKRLKLATARLPLDRFLQWDMGAKNLTLDQVIRILLTLKDTGKWEEALEFVPKRKHAGFYQPRQTGSSGSFFTNKAQTFVKKEAGPTSTYKNAVNRDTRTQPLAQPGAQNVFKSKRIAEDDIKPKSRKNWWEEE
ncbi:tRNA methyltransferase 10 homolog C [Anguilla rostrata]|uniref:tRNA methyltransferase 10 homolog C n=1 Tax=Anguilla rostrata TaxID=7938 RepID=UPI0030CDDF0F